MNYLKFHTYRKKEHFVLHIWSNSGLVCYFLKRIHWITWKFFWREVFMSIIMNMFLFPIFCYVIVAVTAFL